MLQRLPYRMQVPLGLAMAVILAALLMTAVSARISAESARQAMLATFDRAMVLLAAQSRPLLAADDVWRLFVLLRDTAALLPGTPAGRARAAILDAEGIVVAASDPVALGTGEAPLKDAAARGRPLPPGRAGSRQVSEQADGSLVLLDPILSDDGFVLGHVYVEIDASVFEPDWVGLAKPALLGAAIAVLLLVPVGWLVGKRMAKPVASVARCIERIGRVDVASLRRELPSATDPELTRIGEAVTRLLDEMEIRQRAEHRALSAERMAAVGRMTGAVAHEINNPLGGLINAVRTLRLHGDAADVRTRTVDLIDRGLQQIRATVAALLPQARIEDRPLGPDDLDDVAVLAGPAARAQSVQLSTRSEMTAAPLVPASEMRQVMLNLILNAVAAAGGGGRVEASLAAGANRILLRVSNSGKRLTAEELEQAISAESGNDPRGFGLWVCREVATLYGGALQVEDSDDRTTLLFWIPNRERHEDPAAH
jgi:signal transduction histidine kinase